MSLITQKRKNNIGAKYIKESNTQAVPLIINADDFGYSDAVNRAIIHAHLEGVLSSTSLMVNERAVDQAVTLAKAHTTLAVGLHLVTVLGRAALPHSELPHITNERGEFPNSPAFAGMKYYFSPSARREIKREMRVQFERFRDTGLPFSHVDGHNHLHMHPVIFKEMLNLCEEFGVKKIRIVKGEIKTSLKADRSYPFSKVLMGTVFNLLGNWCEKQTKGRNFIHPQKVYGLLQTGNVNEEYLLRLIKNIDKVDAEIYSHPLAHNAPDSELLENPGGKKELSALLSSDVKQLIQNSGFRIAQYETL